MLKKKRNPIDNPARPAGSPSASKAPSKKIAFLITGVVVAVLLIVAAVYFLSSPKPPHAVTTPAPPPTSARPAPAMEPAPIEVPAPAEDMAPAISTQQLPAPLTIPFRYRSYKLSRSDKKKINALIDSLDSTQGLLFQINAYTCYKGPGAFNRELSRKRATSIYRYLREIGISKSAIQVIAHGENRPIATNKTRKGRQKNRRATIIVMRQ